jgi:uroporphyrinogen-III synthase
VKHALKGIGILVTRPREQSGELIKALSDAGGSVFQLPVIEIIPNNPDAVISTARTLSTPDIVIFVSQNAVLYGAAAIRQIASATTKIAAIGGTTRLALSEAGFEIHICPTGRFDSEHLLGQTDLQDVVDKQVLIVRGNTGRELLADTLGRRGAIVNYLATYQRKTATVDPHKLDELGVEWRNGAINIVIVMSVDSLTSLLTILPPDSHKLMRNTRLVTPSKRVIQTAAESLPGIRTVLADGPLADDLVNAINQ